MTKISNLLILFAMNKGSGNNQTFGRVSNVTCCVTAAKKYHTTALLGIYFFLTNITSAKINTTLNQLKARETTKKILNFYRCHFIS